MQGLGPVLPLACPPLTHIRTGDETALPWPPDMPHAERQGLGGSEGIMPVTLYTVKSPSSSLPPSCLSPPPHQPAHSAGLLPPRLSRASSLFPFTRGWSLACCAPWSYAVRLGQSWLRGGTALAGGHSAFFHCWCGSPIRGWSSTPVSGWGDAPISGWGDASIGGWGDTPIGGWGGTAICGWGGTTVCRDYIITLYSKSSITCCDCGTAPKGWGSSTCSCGPTCSPRSGSVCGWGGLGCSCAGLLWCPEPFHESGHSDSFLRGG